MIGLCGIPNPKKVSSCYGMVSYERGEQKLGKSRESQGRVAGLLEVGLTMIISEQKGNKKA